MPTQVGTVFPVAEEWLGIGRELVTATVVAPSATFAVEKVEPDEKLTMLDDNSIRGMMANLFSVTPGTAYADVNFGGNVYLDTIGHVFLNLMGDYGVTGTAGASNGTSSGTTAAGATTMTIVGGTASLPIGTAINIPASAGVPAQVVILSALSTTTSITFANTPLRVAVPTATALTVATAPFTHIFSLLNSSPGQPPTHTLTHYQGLTGSFGAAQYAYWCCSGCSLNMDAEKLFTHETKGMSYLQQAATVAPVNALSNVPVYANWQFAVGIGGPATGGTQVSNVTMASLDITRELKNYFTAAGQQAPYVIGRNALHVEGKFTQVAQNSSPMTEYLTNAQPQIQLKATNGLTGANLLAITFDIQVAAYETAKLVSNEVIEYEVSFRGVANPTNAGASGGQSPLKVTIQNAIPTY